MKRSFKLVCISAVIFSGFITANLYAAEAKKAKEIVYKHTYQYREIASEVKDVGAPYEVDNHIVFTAKAGPRFIGIAFDFENFQTIHPFEIKRSYDIDEKE